MSDIIDRSSGPGPISPLGQAILRALAEERAEGSATPASMSLPRLAKRVGESGSVVLRELSLMSDAVLGGQPGPGWARVWEEGGRWMVAVTAAGLALVAGFATDK